ncbi:DUF2142 domain-containing protein [Methanobrevibacter sp.]|uniref:DUF2142 domain-containing protein n=1 Tax=Methanobrevibacter sp. TaxID=66852 RepID=UPI0026E075D8|nr:DUF2142 domain-containing protein [Methanobrevibacter sp.]
MNEYYGLLLDNKRFVLLYIVALFVFIIPMLSPRNIDFPNFEIFSFVCIAILGSFLILFSVKNKNSLHKVAFAVIMFIGVLMTFIAPPFSIPDEYIHFARVLHVAGGNLFVMDSSKSSVFINGFHYKLLYYIFDLYKFHVRGIGSLLLNNPRAWAPISSVPENYVLRVTTTPFYTYVFSAIGVLLAKILDLGVIWAVWLSRIFNVVFYAAIVSFAIKKTPVYKMQLFFVSLTPLIIPILSSSNYDAFIFAFIILATAYFIYMYKNKVGSKDLLMFFICCLLIGLIKPPFIIFALIILLLPKKNLSYKHPWVMLAAYLLLLFAVSAIIFKGNVMFTQTPSAVSTKPTVSIVGQTMFLINNPLRILEIFGEAFEGLYNFIVNGYYFYEYRTSAFKGLQLYNICYFVFFILFSIYYPTRIQLSKHKKEALIIFFILFYFGMFFLIYLIWCSVGIGKVRGMQARYFLPLMPLVPLAFNSPKPETDKMDNLVFTGIILFAAGVLMMCILHFY